MANKSPVYYVHTVQILKGQHDLSSIKLCMVFIEAAGFSQVMKHLTALYILHQHKEITVVLSIQKILCHVEESNYKPFVTIKLRRKTIVLIRPFNNFCVIH